MDSLYWFWPRRQVNSVIEEEWSWYTRAARDVGLTAKLISVDDIQVRILKSKLDVVVDGREIEFGRAIFHNKVYTWPEFQPDIWRSLALFDILESAGLALIPAHVNITSNDKFATICRVVNSGVEVDVILPTLLIQTRDYSLRGDFIEGVSSSGVVKPSSWGGGAGVNAFSNHNELRRLLKLASASEMSMLVQPDLSLDLSGPLLDLRVLCLRGEPRLSIVRRPRARGQLANLSAGGDSTIEPVPADVHELARAIAALFPVDWIGVDFLIAGTRVYFSEVEIDAYLAPRWMEDDRFYRLAVERMAVYRDRLRI